MENDCNDCIFFNSLSELCILEIKKMHPWDFCPEFKVKQIRIRLNLKGR